jgi:hypothetical protein
MPLRKTHLAAVAVVATGVLAGPALAASVPSKVGTTINLANNSIGALKPGISTSKAKQLLGKPTSTGHKGFAGRTATTTLQYSKYGLLLSFWQGTQGGGPKLRAIRVGSATFKTSKGIRVGSSLTQFRAAYKGAKCFTSRSRGSLPYCVVQSGRNQAQFDIRSNKVSQISLGD